MSDQAKILGLPYQFEFEGQTYPVSPRTFEVEAAFASWLARRDLVGIQAEKTILGPQDYAEQLRGHRHDVAAGVFQYGSPICFQALLSEEGLDTLVLYQMQLGAKKFKGPSVNADMVKRIRANPEKWAELEEFIWRGSDPNVKKPEPANDVPEETTQPTSLQSVPA